MVLNEAAILAARRNKKTIGTPEFSEALERVVAGRLRMGRCRRSAWAWRTRQLGRERRDCALLCPASRDVLSVLYRVSKRRFKHTATWLRGGRPSTRAMAALGHHVELPRLPGHGTTIEDMITTGWSDWAAEVERAIELHPQVAEAAVVGMPDAKRGEVVAAFVRFEDGCVPGEDELVRFLDGKIATFKRPRKIISVETFPRNKAGKILKEELKKTFEGR